MNEIEAEAEYAFDRKMPSSDTQLPDRLKRKELNIPNVSERYLMKHYVNLSQMNYSVDNGPHLLGSCTMKYNPKVSERIASDTRFSCLHPLLPETMVQGSLQILYELERMLCSISGMDAVSLQPAGGAQGEFAGMLMTRAYFRRKGERRKKVLIPDSAHGTNPASAAMAGFDVVELKSRNGEVDIHELQEKLDEQVAALMLTNPNTLGLFEEKVGEIADAVHGAGALLYYDGANMNAVIGKTNPGVMGFDIVHFNLHKTFATPHGGGGPGAGPVGVRSFLERFLPVPRIMRKGDVYELDYNHPESIGKLHSFQGNFSILLRAFAYMVMNGNEGLVHNSESAVLNSNYLAARLSGLLEIPYRKLKKHEFVASVERLKRERDISAMDITKRMIDYGLHPPTVYFPLIVPEALMIEPTENLSRHTLDRIADNVAEIIAEDREILHTAPHSTPVSRVNEVRAARDMIFRWQDLHEGKNDSH